MIRTFRARLCVCVFCLGVGGACQLKGAQGSSCEDAESGEDAFFTGDTLFVGGCGAPFEGSAQNTMQSAFSRLWVEVGPSHVFGGLVM